MDYPIRLPDQLGEHLRSLRKSKGLSQTQLGRKIGVGQARMGEIERNVGSVSLDQLLVVLAALDASLLLHASSEETDVQPGLRTKPTPAASAKEQQKQPLDSAKPAHIKIPTRKGSW